MDEINDIEFANREIRLVQQHIFCESFAKLKMRHRRILGWGGISILALFVLWAIYHCAILHHMFFTWF